MTCVLAVLCLVAQDVEPGLAGEYFNLEGAFPNPGPEAKPAVKRIDKQVNFESTDGAFAGTELADNFYVRWTGVIRIAKEGRYSFFTESDDGSRLFIDGKQVVENGGLHAMEEKEGAIELKAGDHEIKIEFFEWFGDAGCKASWDAGSGKQIMPADIFFHKEGDELKPGLTGEYFDGGRLFPQPDAKAKPVVKRVDKQINWESTEEAFAGTELADNFYVRWAGVIRIPKDGKYTLFTESDDGSRVFVDGKLVVDNGGPHAMEEKEGSVELKAGDHELKVELFEAGGGVGIKFSWEGPGIAKQIVPVDALFHKK